MPTLTPISQNIIQFQPLSAFISALLSLLLTMGLLLLGVALGQRLFRVLRIQQEEHSRA
jgi:hypothetical protein